jgi:DNA-binding transcriptional LysR family regulator
MSTEHVLRSDLNLLPALDALLAEGSVTGAARRLGLTQSAVSRSLGRLRELFGDELFVRSGRGITPTRLAAELAGPLRKALADVEALLAQRGRFEPATARRTFRVAAVDYAQVVVLAPLCARIADEAPGVDVEIRQPSSASDGELESGALDLVLAPRHASGAGIVWNALHDDDYVCLVWRDSGHRRLTLQRFTQLPHVLVAPRERPTGIVDEVLAARGLRRRVAVMVPTFLLVPHVLVGTPYVATVPLRMARWLCREHALRVLRPPIAIPGFTMSQGWHEVHRADPGHLWLRQRTIAIARAALRARGDAPRRQHAR